MASQTEQHAKANAVYEQLKKCIHAKTGMPLDDIFPEDPLDEKYRFTAKGLRAWCPELEVCFKAAKFRFKSEINRNKMEKAATVLNAYNIVCDAMGI